MKNIIIIILSIIVFLFIVNMSYSIGFSEGYELREIKNIYDSI